jgi:hypothetical protein
VDRPGIHLAKEACNSSRLGRLQWYVAATLLVICSAIFWQVLPFTATWLAGLIAAWAIAYSWLLVVSDPFTSMAPTHKVAEFFSSSRTRAMAICLVVITATASTVLGGGYSSVATTGLVVGLLVAYAFLLASGGRGTRAARCSSMPNWWPCFAVGAFTPIVATITLILHGREAVAIPRMELPWSVWPLALLASVHILQLWVAERLGAAKGAEHSAEPSRAVANGGGFTSGNSLSLLVSALLIAPVSATLLVDRRHGLAGLAALVCFACVLSYLRGAVRDPRSLASAAFPIAGSIIILFFLVTHFGPLSAVTQSPSISVVLVVYFGESYFLVCRTCRRLVRH